MQCVSNPPKAAVVLYSTCFGVGGNEEVCGMRRESPDGVPVVGDVVHERHPFDWDHREAIEGAGGALNGLAVG